MSHPPIKGFQCPGIFKDLAEPDEQKCYKMLFSANPDGTAKTWSTGAAYSPDGIHWTLEPQYPLIPFSDTQICPFRDPLLGQFLAFLRFGPPNTRLIARIESEDSVSWSPKVTLFERIKLDEPFATNHYTMQVTPYEGNYLGFLDTYHGETIQPIPEDKLWMDKTNVQLAYSRNGVTWLRVGAHGAFQSEELQAERDWKTEAQQATFLPYGEHKKAWDWGSVYACYQPTIVVDDEIRIYYFGSSGRHWATYHGDTHESAIGLATLRLDGFVSVETAGEGTLTTRPFVFLGDTLEVNADAADGSIRVEALDAQGNAIEGFSRTDCTPISTDGLRHQLAWNGTTNCQLLQARPIRLRFYLQGAKLYSFTPRVRRKHYVQSYD